MRIRCGNCHDTIWVQAVNDPGQSAVVRCGVCSQEYDLAPVIGKVDVERFYADAREFASTGEIDLPAAYSVLLGISTLERVRDMYAADFSGPRSARYDSSFKHAVEAGWLTPAQAAMRGKREMFAQQLVERHGLTKERALEVADNRVPLLEAVRGSNPGPRVEIAYTPRRRRGPFLSIALLAIGGIALAAILVRQPESSLSAAGRTVRPTSPKLISSLEDAIPEVRRNDQGELVEIAGRNPRAILDTYCRSLTRGTVDPVAIERSGEDWTGLYRQNGRLFGITIRRDPRRETWVAGNSVDRIDSRPVATQ